MKKTLLAVAALILVLAVGAFADTEVIGKNTPAVNKRQKTQMKRIRQGVKSGKLTKDEAKALVKDEKDIQKAKKDAKASGTVTPEQRKALQQKLDDESKKIYQEKHDTEAK